MGFKGGSVSTVSLLDLPQKSDLVPVATVDAIMDTGAGGNQGIGSSVTERTYIMKNNRQRIRQTGLINGLEFRTGTSFLANKDNIDSIEIVTFRRDDGDGLYDVISQYDFTALFKALTGDNELFIIPFPKDEGAFAVKDDYWGIRLTKSSGEGSSIIRTNNPAGGTNQRFFDGALGTTNIDVDGTWSSGDNMFKIRPLMKAPYAVGLGTSLSQGEQGIAKDNGAWEDEASVINNLIAYPDKLEKLIGRPVQNSGLTTISTINFVLTNIQDRLLNMKPNIVLMEIGTNDAAQDTPLVNFEADYKSFLDICSQNNIVPVIISVPPRTDLNFARQELRTSYNTFLKAEAKSRGLLFVDVEQDLGIIRASVLKYPFNFWDLQSTYDSGDGIHLDETGYALLARIIADYLLQNQIVAQSLV